MDRISISQLSTRNWWLEEDAIRYASFGFQSIAIWRDKLSDYSIDFVTSLLADLQLSVSSLRWAGGFTGSEGRSFVEAVDDTIDAIRQASQLGTRYLVIHPGDRCFHTRSHSHRLLRTALQELTPHADDFGVQLLLQPMPRKPGKPWTFINDFQTALEFCCEFPGQTGLILNLYDWSATVEELLGHSQLREFLKIIQLTDRQPRNEGNRTLLGQGALPLKSWIRKLERSGFTGAFEVELFGPGIEAVTYANRLKQTRSFFKELAQPLA